MSAVYIDVASEKRKKTLYWRFNIVFYYAASSWQSIRNR